MPAKKETPIVLDMSQACASVGKLQIAAKKGEKIPFGWATDNYGNPTDDPNKVLGGKGMYLPIGTYKGFGQAVIVEVLCGLLGGMAWNSMHGLMDEIDQPANVGHFFFAIDIDAFTDIEQFKELVDHLIQSIKDTPLAAGFERVYSPGEPETEAEHRYKTAVPILLNTLDELNQAAATFKLSDRLTPLLNTR